jgi:hypothetical protein
MSNPTDVYLDIFIGNREEHEDSQAAYEATSFLLSKSAKIYGLPTLPADLTEDQREILADLDVYDLNHACYSTFDVWVSRNPSLCSTPHPSPS